MKRRHAIIAFALAAASLVAQSAFTTPTFLDRLPVTPTTLRLKADAAEHAASPEFVGPTTEWQRGYFAGMAEAYRETADALELQQQPRSRRPHK